MEAKVSDFEHEAAVHYTVGRFEVPVTVEDTAVQVRHSLKKYNMQELKKEHYRTSQILYNATLKEL